MIAVHLHAKHHQRSRAEEREAHPDERVAPIHLAEERDAPEPCSDRTRTTRGKGMGKSEEGDGRSEGEGRFDGQREG